MVVYTVTSLLTHMMVVLPMHLLEAVMEHRAAACGKARLQEDSMGQMVTHTAMVGLLVDKLVEAEVHIAMGLVEHLCELVDVVRQNVAVTNKWSSGCTALC